MKNIIPGHVRAFTWMLALVITGVAFLCTKNLESAIGSIILVFGAFMGDQATHLHQEDHSAPPPTGLERMLQKYRIASILLGLALAGIGTFLIVNA